jgi:hypothetical protein
MPLITAIHHACRWRDSRLVHAADARVGARAELRPTEGSYTQLYLEYDDGQAEDSVRYRVLGEYADLYARWCAEYWDEPRVAQAFLWAQFDGRSAQSVYDDAVLDATDLREKVRRL